MTSWMKIYDADNPEAVRRLDLALHGAKFALENLLFDSEGAVAELTFEHTRPSEWVVKPGWPPFWKIQVPVRLWRLRFQNVTRIHINDLAEVGCYEFDSLGLLATGAIRLEAVPPLSVILASSMPSIEVEVSTNIIGSKLISRISITRPVPMNEDPLPPSWA